MCNAKSFSDAENARSDSNDQHQTPHDLRTQKKLCYIDDAISKAKFGLFNYIIIGVTGLTLFAALLETCSIAYMLPVLCDMNLTTGQKGVLAGAGHFGIICSSHLWGYLADTRGRHCVILPALLTAFTLSVICSFVQNFYIFTILRFLCGFFVCAAGGNIYAYLGEFHNNAQRGRAIMVAAVIFSGLCLAFPTAAWLLINQDWQFEVPFINQLYKPPRLFMVVCGIPGLLSALILMFLPESPKFVLGQGNKMAAYQILEKMNRWNNGKNVQFELFEICEEAESIENRKRILEIKKSKFPLLNSVWNQTAPLFKPPYLKTSLLVCALQFGIFATSMGFGMLFGEVVNKLSANVKDFYNDRIMMCDNINMKPINSSVNSEVCVEKLNSSTIEVGVYIEVIFAIGSALAGFLINKIGKFPVIFFVLITTGCCAIGCALTDIPAVQVSLYTTSLSCGIASNVVSSATVELYPTALRAMAMSISLMFGRIGSVFGSNAAAFLLDDHCEVTFYLSGSILLVIGVLSFFIPNVHKRVTKSEHDQSKSVHRPSILSLSGSVRGF